ncbi:hypothetical protein B9T16_11065 [Arthrospira sp. PCC 8006]
MGRLANIAVRWIGELLFKAPLPYGRGVWGEGFTSKGEPVNLPVGRLANTRFGKGGFINLPVGRLANIAVRWIGEVLFKAPLPYWERGLG